MRRDVGGNDRQAHRQGLADAEIVALPLGEVHIDVGGGIEIGELLVGDIGHHRTAPAPQPP